MKHKNFQFLFFLSHAAYVLVLVNGERTDLHYYISNKPIDYMRST